MTHIASDSLAAALAAAALLGVRHGMDCDHIAALGDLVNIERRVGHSVRLGLAYIAGHSLVIAILGSAAICMQLALPPTIDRWMGRLVGFTLVAFSLYIGYSLVRSRRHIHFHGQSRATLLMAGFRWLLARFGRRCGRSTVSATASSKYANHSSFFVGIIHGFGAETPTQILLFLMTAKLGGVPAGLLALLLFVLAMGIVNTLLCVVMAQMFLKTASSRKLQRALSGITAGYSLVIGTIMLAGR